jgi:hypothetical protein
MLDNIDNFKINRSALIGRPKLSLVGQKCGNIVCNKDNEFKMLKKGIYICECGYRLEGEFEEIKHKMRFGCSAIKCPMGKIKMDSGCLSCEFIIER